MAGQMVKEGLRVMSDAIYKTNATPEDKFLCLFTNDYTITDATVYASLRVLAASGGNAATLTKATWDAATDADPVVSRYNGSTGVTFNFTGTVACYGYAVAGVTSSALYGAENFGLKSYVNGENITIAPLDMKLDIPE